MTPASSPSIRHYFVDEAGDLNLFNKKGRVLLGTPGVSNFFMVGVALLPDPVSAHQKLEALRAALLADPYFKGVSSFKPEAKKTALAFHAKDDLPEVRREVFKLLLQFGAQVQVVIRRKSVLVQEGRTLFRYGQKLRPQAVYDDLIARVFHNMLHQADQNLIVFARRGVAPRIAALAQAINHAKQLFVMHGGELHDKPTEVWSGFSSQFAGLQVVDYYLWALQRLYETGEDRFFDLLARDYRLIIDMDDTRQQSQGTWYGEANPLTLDKIKQPPTD